MKKLSALVAVAFLSLSFVHAHPQIVMNDRMDPMNSKMEPTDRYEPIAANALNGKVLRNFFRAYKNANGAEWMVLKDKSVMCRFHMDDVLYRAFYTPGGLWLQTASGYGPDKLDGTVKEMIKSSYRDYTISYVDQLDLPMNKTIYLVEVQDEKSIKKIRVADDEMDVIQEFEKN